MSEVRTGGAPPAVQPFSPTEAVSSPSAVSWATPVAASSSSSAAPAAVPKYILVTRGETTPEENAVLRSKFNQVLPYHPQLHSGNFDLASMVFDLLLVNVKDPVCHQFLEVIASQAKDLKIPIIVLKKRMPNFKRLAKAIEGDVMAVIEDFLNPNFMLLLGKTKVPKAVGRVKHFLQQCLSLASSLQ
jgi:hypothetical protein